MKQSIFSLLILFLLLVTPLTAKNDSPAVEVRAVWLTTNWNLDWPNPNISIEKQKAQLREMLDKLRESNFNTVFFQVRIRGDVFYNSKIEPMSPFAKKGFDALQFAVNECHKRGIECHAWFVTYPVGSKKQVARHGKNSIVRKRPDLCKFYNGEWYLDPGNPLTRNYLLSLVNEIVGNYDIDGIHFDYIRYPEKAAKFPDNGTFKKYGNGMKLADWRRNNINLLVSEIYDAVKKQKPWVQVSSSPIGKYRNLSVTNGTWTALESVYQDAAHWLKTGKHDALYPMMYYKNDHFYPFLKDWMANCHERPVIPGLGVYQMLANERNWQLKDITDQIDSIRENRIQGQAHFRAGNVLNNLKGINSVLQEKYYKYPAKFLPMPWLENIAPNSPVDFEASVMDNGKLKMKWQNSDISEQQTFTVYWSYDEEVDTNNPENILATGIRSNEFELNIIDGEFGLYYSLTASDRFHNESVPCFPAFVIHSSQYKK